MHTRLFHALALVAVISLSAFNPRDTNATEFDLSAYLIDSNALAAAIGSNDRALETRLLKMTDFVEHNGLESRFTPPDTWKTAVADLIAGRERKNEYINPFVIWMLVDVIGKKPEPGEVGAPFADFSILTRYFNARGDGELAGILNRINFGNTTEPFDGLPSALKSELGAGEYPAQISVFTPADASKLLALLPTVKAAEEEMLAFTGGGSSSKAAKAEAAIREATTKDLMKYYQENPDSLDGQPIKEVVDERVKSELSDPYAFGDSLTALAEAIPTLENWLNRAKSENREIIFFYETF